MNIILKKLNCDEKHISSSDLEIKLNDIEASSIHPTSFVTGESFFDELGAIFSTIPAPSISDFFSDSSSDYYEAKAERDQAKIYKETMKAERERLYNAREAMRNISKLEAIYEIANLLAETLTTQFINNNYAITEQYNTIHSQIESINNNLYSAPVLSDVNWSNVRLLMR